MCVEGGSVEGAAFPPDMGDISLGCSTMNTPLRPRPNPASTEWGPYSVLEDGSHACSLDGMRNTIWECQSGLVAQSGIESSIALPRRGKLLPDSSKRCIPDHWPEARVRDNINSAEKGKVPGVGCRASIPHCLKV